MGQYHLTVNLDKREFLDPHKLGDGLKLWEQLNSQGGVMAALHILLACSNGRGGGDLYRTVKRDGVSYEEPEAPEWVGRWSGDRIAVVGDYAEDSDLAPEHRAGSLYDRCRQGEFRDISDDVLPLVERACDVKITGDGWRDKTGTRALRPDMLIISPETTIGPKE